MPNTQETIEDHLRAPEAETPHTTTRDLEFLHFVDKGEFLAAGLALYIANLDADFTFERIC